MKLPGGESKKTGRFSQPSTVLDQGDTSLSNDIDGTVHTHICTVYCTSVMHPCFRARRYSEGGVWSLPVFLAWRIPLWCIFIARIKDWMIYPAFFIPHIRYVLLPDIYILPVWNHVQEHFYSWALIPLIILFSELSFHLRASYIPDVLACRWVRQVIVGFCWVLWWGNDF